jgi:hypothetical protein
MKLKHYSGVLVIMALAALSSRDYSRAANSPALPLAYIDTAIHSSIRSISVSRGGDLQAAINNANPGDEILLPAGAVFTGPITLKNKSGSGWITIRTDSTLPAPGIRVGPGDASNMARIVAPGRNEPAIKAASGAHHYRLIGIEVTKINSSAATGDLILFGENTSAQTSLSSVPRDIILDRVYAHGDSSSDLKHCVTLNGASLAVIDSYISDCHSVGQDAQAIFGSNGPGPFKIVNNYLEGAGENVLFGGDDPKIPGLIPSDIEFRQNYVTKPAAWRNGSPHWLVKNLFELKNAQRALIDGNVFENSWQDGQSGFAILFNTTNQGGGCPWCAAKDITFTNNIVRHAGGGVSMQANDYHYPNSDGRTQNIDIANNMFWDIDSGNWGGNGWLFYLPSGSKEQGPDNVRITHNTAFNDSTVIYFDGYDASAKKFFTKPGFVFRDNIAFYNSYGVFGNGVGSGDSALNTYAPGSAFDHNLFIDNKNVNASKSLTGRADNFFTSSMASADLQSAGDASVLGSGSQFLRSSSDGKTLGADVRLIQRAMNAIVPQPTVTPVPTLTPTPTAVPTLVPSVRPTPPSTPPLPTPTPTPLPPVVVAPSPINPGRLYRAEGDPKVYFVNSMGQKRWIPTLRIFNSYGFRWPDVSVVGAADLGPVPDSVLVRTISSPRVFHLNGMGKNWIPSLTAFNRRGFRWQDVDIINQTELSSYRTGTPLY